MMKQLIFTGALLLASAMTGEAMALCPLTNTDPTWHRVINLIGTLNGMTACDATATYDTCRKHPSPGCKPTVMGIQEEHHSDGTLWDFKCGPDGYNGPGTGSGTACEKPDTDRRKQVGTWNVSSDGGNRATVKYTYTDSGVGGPLRVFTDGAVYDFCSSNDSVSIITLKPTTPGARVCP